MILKHTLIIILLISFYGCEQTEKSKIKTDTLIVENSPPSIKQTLFKGMVSGVETFSECGSGKKLIISPDGENNELEKAVTYFSSKKPGQQFYVEAEGFSSARERPNGKGFDTMLVITRFIKLDMVRSCED